MKFLGCGVFRLFGVLCVLRMFYVLRIDIGMWFLILVRNVFMKVFGGV